MDCCNYGEYHAASHAQYGGGAGGAAWDAPYAPPYAPYAPYAHAYYAHDPYLRYNAFRYDYAHQAPHNEHAMSMDYGPYSSKDLRVRRAVARRDARSRTPIQHLPLPQTPPLECGMNGRGPGFCEPQMWHHYQMNVMNGGGWGNGVGGWGSRSLSCSREPTRYPTDVRSIKASYGHTHNGYSDGRSTPYMYEEQYSAEAAAMRRGLMVESMPTVNPAHARVERTHRELNSSDNKPLIPTEKPRPAIVPLPAFQQAFGSTEIGKFAEAFSRTEKALEEFCDETFPYESLDWDGPPEPQWSAQPTTRKIKCEDSF